MGQGQGESCKALQIIVYYRLHMLCLLGHWLWLVMDATSNSDSPGFLRRSEIFQVSLHTGLRLKNPTPNLELRKGKKQRESYLDYCQ